jgi:hypothetical protein
MSHNSRIYKVYAADEIDNIDMTLYQDSLRWNNDSTEFILEYIDVPETMVGKLTYAEALSLMQTDSWLQTLIIPEQ